MINGRKVGFYANGTLLEMPMEKTAEILKNIGYDAIELNTAWAEKCGSDAEMARQLKVIGEAGLTLSEFVIQLDYVALDKEVRRQAIEQTKDYIRRCADLGIGTVNLFSGPRPWIPNRISVGDQVTQGQAWNMVFEAFDELVPLAEEKKVSLAVESVWAMLCCDFYTTSYLVNHYNSPYLGVNYDPSHDQLYGNTDMEFMIRQFGAEKIKHMHMKDAAGSQVRGRVLFPPLGTGLVDWDSFVRGINAIDYQGVMSVEYEADQHLARNLKGDWVKAAQESYQALQNILG